MAEHDNDRCWCRHAARDHARSTRRGDVYCLVAGCPCDRYRWHPEPAAEAAEPAAASKPADQAADSAPADPGWWWGIV